MSRAHAEILRSIDLFAELTPAELEQLANPAVMRDYAPGEVLFLEGQPCQGLWIIASGAANIVKTTPMGRQFVLATQLAPATVAEVPVFDGGPYPASVIAVQPTQALFLPKQDFLHACRTNPALTMRFLRTFGKRLRHLVTLAERVTFGTIRQRLAQDFLDRSEAASSNSFPLEETQEQLAFRLGTVREVVSRNLSRFQSEGLLRMDRKSVDILDPEGLRREAETEL